MSKKTQLALEIERVHAALIPMNVSSDEYRDAIKQLNALYEMKEKSYFVKPETVLVVAAGMIQLIGILGYEHAHVITSKALSYVFKAKL